MIAARARLLELARVAAGYTQGELASELGVTQAFISQVEREQRQPNDDFVERWAAATNVPPSFFLVAAEPVGEGKTEILHRRRATLPLKPMKRAHALANSVRIELGGLFEEVELEPAIDIPRVDPGVGPEEAAAETRISWRAPRGPLLNLIGHVEAAGIPVIYADLFHPKLSALTLPGLSTDWLILLNERLPADHNRHSLAHELGHIVLRHHRPATRHDTTWNYPDDLWEDDHVSEELEDEANRFAAELLLPEADVKPELRDLRFHQLGPLKQRWRVSMASLVRRAGQVGCIGRDAQRSLYIQLGRLPGGRHNEPGAFEREESALVKTVIGTLLEDEWTPDDVAAAMPATEGVLRERYLGERKRLQTVSSTPRPRPVTRLSRP